MEKTTQLIQDLCLLPGVSGCEEAVREAIARQLEGHCQMETDARGNLICHKKGRRTPDKKIMIAAHMDEVGFLITHIEEDGMLRFANVGGVDTRVVIGKPVMLESGVPGVVGAKPIHLQKKEEQDNPLPMSSLYIDIGASSREEAERLVQLGDRVTFRTPWRRLGQHKVQAKALDDRAGCAVLVRLLQQELEYDITAVFTTLEEVGSVGATCAAYAQQPQIGIALECTSCADVPGVSPDRQVAVQGEGPCLSIKDKSTLYDRDLYRMAMALAKEKSIPCQFKRATTGGNDSKAMQRAGDGARVLALAMPARYIHSGASVLDLRDVDATLRLLPELIAALGQE